MHLMDLPDFPSGGSRRYTRVTVDMRAWEDRWRSSVCLLRLTRRALRGGERKTSLHFTSRWEESWLMVGWEE